VTDALSDADLVGSPVAAADLPYLALVFGNAEVGKTLGGTRSEEQILAIYSHWRDAWQRYDFGPFVFRDQRDTFIGYSGLLPAPIGEPGDVELLYGIVPEFWGRGVTTRMSRLVVDWAFAERGLDQLVAYTLPTNHASQGVMKKLGFRYQRDVDKAGMPHVLYRLTPDEWSAARDG